MFSYINFVSSLLILSPLFWFCLILSFLVSSRLILSHLTFSSHFFSSLLVLHVPLSTSHPVVSFLFWSCLILSLCVSSHLLLPLLISFCLFTSHLDSSNLASSLLILYHHQISFHVILTLLLLHLLTSHLLFSFYLISSHLFFSFCILPSLLVSFNLVVSILVLSDLVSSLSYNHVQFRVEYADCKLVESLEKLMSYRKSKSKSAETSTLVLVQNYSVGVVSTQVVQTLACTPHNPHQVRGHMDTDTSPC